MTEFIDRFPNLPQVINIGGDKYFMGSQKPIELGFKSRKNYIDSFTNDTNTEYLLRKYMYYSLQAKRKLKFDTPEDKKNLIKILKKRAQQLKTSSEFTSSTLKNTIIQRSFLNIQELIKQLEGPEYKGFELPKIPDIDILPCTQAKKYIKQISDDAKFKLILEIAWYLLHPDKIPSQVECDWAKLIKQLDTLRIGDIVAEIRQTELNQGISLPTNQPTNPFNYFKKIDLEQIAKAPTIRNALDRAKQFATEIEGENASSKMKERLKILLDILEMKKYLANDLQVDNDRMKIIDTNVASKIKKNMIMNPMSGGASKTLDKPLGVAMKPFFEYFKNVYDPIYTLIDDSLRTQSNASEKTQKVIIPLLTTLLYICNNLNPSETNNSGANTYGIYKVTNVDKDLVDFLNNMLGSTQKYIDQFSGDNTKKNIFNQQLFKLPKVRLTSLLNKTLNSFAKNSDDMPYIQFFTVGGNMELMSQEELKKIDKGDEVFNAINDFFTKDNIYIVCTKSDNISEDIPMNLYEINYELIDVDQKGMEIDNILDNYFNNYFNKNKEPAMYLEKLVKLTPYVVFNDAELALSIFIAFKELMPK
jgi:hypothetical protein